jgi:CheY-like chemotaxis protein
MKVLIVDDDECLLKVLENIVRGLGYECHSVNNGLTALDILKNDFTFDVIICDFNMPLLTGLELRFKIESELGSCPPFILISGDISQVKEEIHRKMFYALLEKASGIKLIENKLKEIEARKKV